MKVFIESGLTFVYDFGNGVLLIPGPNEIEASAKLDETLKGADFKKREKLGQFKVINEAQAKKMLADMTAEARRREEEEKAKSGGN